MPKRNMGQSGDGEDLRHERRRMMHVHCRNDQLRGGPQGTDRGAGRVARPKWCVKWTPQLDRGMVEMRPATSLSIRTSLCTPMSQRSWAVTVPFRTRQQMTARCWCITRKTVKQPVRARLKQARSLYSWQCSQVEPLCASSNAESCDIEPSTTALNNTTLVFWHGRWVLVWLMVVAADTFGWSAMWFEK